MGILTQCTWRGETNIITEKKNHSIRSFTKAQVSKYYVWWGCLKWHTTEILGSQGRFSGKLLASWQY